MTAIQQGSLIEIDFESRKLEAIIIDPNGLGEGKPSIGMGLRMTDRHMGIPQQTLSDWCLSQDSGHPKNIAPQGIGSTREGVPVTLPATASGHPQSLTTQETETDRKVILVSPSKKQYFLHRIVDEHNREQLVVEASDWLELAADVLETPGKVKRPTQIKIIHFLKWFAVKGFYASCYARIFGSYTSADDDRLTSLIQENQQLKADVAELAIEYARLEYRNDQLNYENDELAEMAQWRRFNSFTGRDC